MKTPALLIGSFVALVGVFACSSSSNSTPAGSSSSSGLITGCNDNPWSCPAGQTCAPADPNGTSFVCENSGKGNAGDPCVNYVTPECADGLTCFAVVGYAEVCTQFCDPTNPAHACPNKATCKPLVTKAGQKLYECVPPKGAGGGGQGGGGGSSSSSTSSSSTSTSTSSSSGAGGNGAGGAGGKGAGGAGGGP